MEKILDENSDGNDDYDEAGCSFQTETISDTPRSIETQTVRMISSKQVDTRDLVHGESKGTSVNIMPLQRSVSTQTSHDCCTA